MNAPSEKVVRDAKVLVADIEELLKATAAQTGEKVDAARARLHAALDDAKDAVTLQTLQAARATDRYVHENPWRVAGISAGITAAAAILVGFLLSKR